MSLRLPRADFLTFSAHPVCTKRQKVPRGLRVIAE